MNDSVLPVSKTPLLSATDITTWRGETCVLDEVSVSVHSGEVWQVTGPNGSGKTTLLRTLAGLALPDEGHVEWRGRSIHSVRADYHSELLYLGHKAGINGALTPRENLAAFLNIRHRKPNLKALDEALNALGLGERLDLPCRWLSAGQQRRVALARLLLEPVTLWVLDEPLNALDVDGVAWVVNRIEQQVAMGGAVMFTTHQPMTFQNTDCATLDLHSTEMHR